MTNFPSLNSLQRTDQFTESGVSATQKTALKTTLYVRNIFILLTVIAAISALVFGIYSGDASLGFNASLGAMGVCAIVTISLAWFYKRASLSHAHQERMTHPSDETGMRSANRGTDLPFRASSPTALLLSRPDAHPARRPPNTSPNAARRTESPHSPASPDSCAKDEALARALQQQEFTHIRQRPVEGTFATFMPYPPHSYVHREQNSPPNGSFPTAPFPPATHLSGRENRLGDKEVEDLLRFGAFDMPAAASAASTMRFISPRPPEEDCSGDAKIARQLQEEENRDLHYITAAELQRVRQSTGYIPDTFHEKAETQRAILAPKRASRSRHKSKKPPQQPPLEESIEASILDSSFEEARYKYLQTHGIRILEEEGAINGGVDEPAVPQSTPLSLVPETSSSFTCVQLTQIHDTLASVRVPTSIHKLKRTPQQDAAANPAEVGLFIETHQLMLGSQDEWINTQNSNPHSQEKVRLRTLFSTHPELSQALFLQSRGDTDCLFHSLAHAVFFRTVLPSDSQTGLQTLMRQIVAIHSTLTEKIATTPEDRNFTNLNETFTTCSQNLTRHIAQLCVKNTSFPDCVNDLARDRLSQLLTKYIRASSCLYLALHYNILPTVEGIKLQYMLAGDCDLGEDLNKDPLNSLTRKAEGGEEEAYWGKYMDVYATSQLFNMHIGYIKADLLPIDIRYIPDRLDRPCSYILNTSNRHANLLLTASSQ